MKSIQTSAYICQCFKITDERLAEIAADAGSVDFDHLRTYYEIGSRCTACEIDVRDFLHELAQDRVPRTGTSGVPLRVRARTHARALKAEARIRTRQLLNWPRRFAVFMVRGHGFESELVLSNLCFPDDARNANGRAVKFDTQLRDAQGREVGPVKRWSLESDHSRAYALDDLAPEVPGEFVGTVFLRFYGLRETGSLRPYCRLRHHRTSAGYQGSTHYHDQFLTRPHYQHVIVTHPIVEGQRCFLALSNPLDETYRSPLHLRSGEEEWTVDVEIPGHGAMWAPVDALFPDAPAQATDAFLWLGSADTVMAWFFWHHTQADVWVAQHK